MLETNKAQYPHLLLQDCLEEVKGFLCTGGFTHKINILQVCKNIFQQSVRKDKQNQNKLDELDLQEARNSLLQIQTYLDKNEKYYPLKDIIFLISLLKEHQMFGYLKDSSTDDTVSFQKHNSFQFLQEQMSDQANSQSIQHSDLIQIIQLSQLNVDSYYSQANEKALKDLNLINLYLNELILKIEQNNLNTIYLFLLIEIGYFLNEIEQNKQSGEEEEFCNIFTQTKIIKVIELLINQSNNIDQNTSNLDAISIQKFLTFQFLLKVNTILTKKYFNDQKLNDQISAYLLHYFLQEKDDSVKIIFFQDFLFIYKIENLTIENKFAELYREFQQNLGKIFQTNETSKDQNSSQVSGYVDILRQNQIQEAIKNELLKYWETTMIKTLLQQKEFRDETILEIEEFYIDQKINYLEGNNLLEMKDDQINNQQIATAIDEIIQYFILPNTVQTNEKTNCKILSILADSGTGKSILLKKLETIIIEEKMIQDKKNNQLHHVIPLLIKCKSLELSNPYIESYLLVQNYSQQLIKAIKESNRLKVILLDGYDEFSGNNFNVYSTLNLKQWQNTIIIVTSRKEEFKEGDACQYFSIEERGERDESLFAIFNLEEFQIQQIREYCKNYFSLYRKNCEKEQQEKLVQSDLFMMNKLLENNQILQQLFLPLNLYIITRHIVSIQSETELNEFFQSQITNQIQIQEIFFRAQFSREADKYVSQEISETALNSSSDHQKLKGMITLAYFQYFEQMALQMFLKKGFSVNYLQVKRNEIPFFQKEDLKGLLSIDQQFLLEENIRKYINSKIITKIIDKGFAEKDLLQIIQIWNKINFSLINTQLIEFKHKSLFEYFTARAMKSDFDILGEDIFKTDIKVLQRFNINKKIIMSFKKNQSEKQILIKLFEMLNPEIKSQQFKNNYNEEDISKTNRYIQFLRRSTINSQQELSILDIGASNLLSALFMSNFAFSELNFKKCSFSKAYIPKSKSLTLNFDQCNLSDAYLLEQNLTSFEASNTQNSSFGQLRIDFQTNIMCSINQIISFKNKFIACTNSGYLQIISASSQGLQIDVQKKISCNSLDTLNLVDGKIIASGQQTLFDINQENFEINSTLKFKTKILKLEVNKHLPNFLVQLFNEDNKWLFGNVSNGFQQIKILGINPILTKNYIIIYSGNQLLFQKNCNQFDLVTSIQADDFSLRKLENNFEIIFQSKKEDDPIKLFKFSNDSKVLEDNKIKIQNYLMFNDNLNQLKNGCHIIVILISRVMENILQIVQIQINFSPDNSVLLVLLDDISFSVYDAQNSFNLIETQDKFKVLSFAFSSSVRVIDIPHEEEEYDEDEQEQYDEDEDIEILLGQTAILEFMLFSKNDSYFAAYCSNYSINIWDLKNDFSLIRTLSHSYRSSLTISPDEINIALLDCDWTHGGEHCKILNLQKDLELSHILKLVKECEDDDVKYVCYSPNGRYLIVAKVFKIFLYSVEKNYETISIMNFKVENMVFSADSQYLVARENYYFYKFLNLDIIYERVDEIKKISYIFNGFQTCFSPCGKYLVKSGNINGCVVYDIKNNFESMKIIQLQAKTELSTFCVAYSPDSKYLATGYADGFKIWEIEQDFDLIQQINTGYSTDNYVSDIKFSQNGKYIAVTVLYSGLYIFEGKFGFNQLHKIQKEKSYEYKSIMFSSDNTYLALQVFAKVYIYNIKNNFEMIAQFDSNSSFFSPNSSEFYTLSNHINIFNIKQQFEKIKEIQVEKEIKIISCSQDAKYLITIDNEYLNLHHIQNGFELTKSIFIGNVNYIDISKDNKYIAIISKNHLKIFTYCDFNNLYVL
ncbi:WD domain, G-beta repeat protein (macronuclear) [Tetrahymena thermophila SB210]|uniref:WD domain, G-beta repeat protein n=1 Tax=Tetrahymena thermophila (strain SB210) TaxID=312017 RepID=Q23BS5_TETTS|nr:WD domain, G-beta repeat protein [Tetrahymena thermophila SB210]EAR94043.2 WD domain, G-beta repeat protein [Tetrahymena thermophila SB210]|eukprot:XP_001014288.2 WD domain, G-beta repeat protein [Tetrahymena thermophila SB210]